jgi:Rrf2 family protein
LKFSTKTRYGIRAILDIALNQNESGVLQKDIAARQEISVKYLDHIIHALKVGGLVTNLRGKKSGYVLTREPSQITIYDIHNAFEPGICVIDCMSHTYMCSLKDKCAARGFWGELNKRITDYFKGITLEDIMKKSVLLEDALQGYDS